jgi:hypothetical protein
MNELELLLLKMHKEGRIPVTGTYFVLMPDESKVEFMYNCRFCDDGENFPERDTWNQSTETHSTVVENCEKCGRGKL